MSVKITIDIGPENLQKIVDFISKWLRDMGIKASRKQIYQFLLKLIKELRGGSGSGEDGKEEKS